MSASLTLLTVVLLLTGLAIAGARWGVDTRAPGGWDHRREPAPLWPVDPRRGVRRTVERSPTDR